MSSCNTRVRRICTDCALQRRTASKFSRDIVVVDLSLILSSMSPG